MSTGTAAVRQTARRYGFRVQLRDFLRFIVRPRLAPRMPLRPATGFVAADWRPGLTTGQALKWLALLWTVNLVVFGPIAAAAATAGGAEHRLNIHAIPWFHGILWAPVVEELVFRYGLRRMGQVLWVVPLAAVLLAVGPGALTWPLLPLLVWLCVRGTAVHRFDPARASVPGQWWRRRKHYVRLFPWAFHISSLSFAAVHLHNFQLHQTPWWLIPALVVPQWITGMALAWMRVRKGIGTSMLMHGLFNAGPLLLIWAVLRLAPDAVL